MGFAGRYTGCLCILFAFESMINMLAIEKALADFLKKHYNPKKPVLLALSGGPDSLLLFHILLQLQQRLHLEVGIAHVDHGWREESVREADLLAALAARHFLPFHLKTLNPKDLKGNLEAACREERLRFFSQLCEEHHYQAVLLGHHAGDFVETVLKRILEGASLPNLSGMSEITQLDGIAYWRPWLRFTKQEILNAIKHFRLMPFEDATNRDPRFLRARFRTKILPWLTQEFGKEIEPSIQRLGWEALELKNYLEVTLAKDIDKIQASPFGYVLDVSQMETQHPFALKFFIKKFCEKGDFSLSRDFLEKTLYLLQTLAANKEILMGAHKLYIDRGRLFLVQREPVVPKDPLIIKPGEFDYGSWKVRVELSDNFPNRKPTSWKEAWKGQGEVYLPEGSYQLKPLEFPSSYPGHSPISRWLTNAKVPAFLRGFLPVVTSDGEICAEFLTGRENDKFKDMTKNVRVQFEFIGSGIHK
jgi:tRNA(Ile)-lysidine synthase